MKKESNDETPSRDHSINQIEKNGSALREKTEDQCPVESWMGFVVTPDRQRDQEHKKRRQETVDCPKHFPGILDH